MLRKHFLLAFNPNKAECTPKISEVSRYEAGAEVINCVAWMAETGDIFFRKVNDHFLVMIRSGGRGINNYDLEFYSSDQSELDFLDNLAIITFNVLRSLLNIPMGMVGDNQTKIDRVLACYVGDDGFCFSKMMIVCFLVMETEMTTEEILKNVELSKRVKQGDIPVVFEIAVVCRVSLAEAVSKLY